MNVRNVHQRELEASPEQVGALLEDPARMWPDRWPELREDHVGFLRHEPFEREPGRLRFRITGPRGFTGWHGWEVERANGHAVLRHTVDAECTGWVRIGWPLVIKPIHDALHEDVLDRAAEAVGSRPARRPWSRWVRFLRWGIRKAGRST